MSLQRMPVIDSFVPGKNVRVAGQKDLIAGKVSVQMSTLLGRAKRVIYSDTISRMIYERAGTSGNSWELFGSVRLPFDSIVLAAERHDPAHWTKASAVMVPEVAKRFLATLGSKPIEESGEESYVIISFGEAKGLLVVFSPPIAVTISNEGRILKVVPWATDTMTTDLTGGAHGQTRLKDSPEWANSVTGIAFPALMAIGLMNCKNVKVHESRFSRRPKRVKGRKVQDHGAIYHTIHLPGSGSSEHDGPGSGAPAEHRLHMVRGHFKTFTEDAPLMGKHTGTYWWGWQVRGDKENGVSVTDYNVANPAA